MDWHKYSIIIDPSQEDAVTALLYSLGIEGVEIEDGLIPTEEELGRMFVDLSPELAPDELPAAAEPKISFYLRVTGGDGDATPQSGDATDDSYTIHDRLWSPEEEQALLRQLRKNWARRFPGKPLRLESGVSREEDWRDTWKQYYQPLLVNDLLILPVWETVPEEHADAVSTGTVKLIRLDPGTAFGSGTHESTRLCLDGLKKWMRGGEMVLDIGCGSGILGLAALQYGASSVTATELDPACSHVIEENLSLNGVSGDRFYFREGNILSDPALVSGRFDLVLCNILAPVIIALAAPGAADRYVKTGGIFITSGIYKEHQQAVEAAFRANPAWEFVETVPLNDWVSVVARRA
ncbi:MAG: 50S ribosomal protein L11 methyltransferase [Lachnospiraceae bacterium]|nr:50S ribosomal protein L11 methyltransferase [Lachnospiraceae bacterium]